MKTRNSGAQKAGGPICMTPHDTFLSVNLYFLSFPAFSPEAGKVVFLSCFTYEKGRLAGGGIEPPTRGFSVHCSAN
jgi:hypothetical protein